MSTTPPAPSTPRMPPTPRFGGMYDQYEPYATRCSARIAGQRASRDSTPPPRFPALAAAGSRSPKKEQSNHDKVEALSPPGSIHGSPRKKPAGRSRAFHSLDDDTLGLADPFTLRQTSPQQHPRPELQTTRTNGMLPTPAKTPKKKAVGDMGTTARSLFPPSFMSGRPKKGKKHTDFSLDSFNDDAAPNETKIEIYTDCRDRIPEVDESEGNPFYKPKEVQAVQTPVNPAPRVSRKPKAAESKDKGRKHKRDQEVEDAVNRDDGMVYVFRGKKMFRKFNDQPETDGEDDDDLGLLAARPDLVNSPTFNTNVRPLTRSSIKPRVLFPSARDTSAQQDPPSEVDEEAATDIEDHAKETDEVTDQPTDGETQQRPSTPPSESTAAAPPSPDPSTVRSLRSRAKPGDTDQHGATPTVSEPKRKRVSPFDGWLRKKPAPAVPRSKKREAEAASSPGGPSTKRTRGNRAAVPSS